MRESPRTRPGVPRALEHYRKALTQGQVPGPLVLVTVSTTQAGALSTQAAALSTQAADQESSMGCDWMEGLSDPPFLPHGLSLTVPSCQEA